MALLEDERHEKDLILDTFDLVIECGQGVFNLN